MAIGRISGQMLKSNLLRSGVDLAFETDLLVLDVSNNFVGVGTSTPARQLHISGTGALRLPSGTTAQRGTAAPGDIRYNSELSTIEGYTNSEWKNLASGTSLKDTDGNTGVDVERSADANEIHFFTETSGDVAHIRDNGNIELNNLQIADRTISSLVTNGDITITPNGTGRTSIKNLTVTDGLDLGDLQALNVGEMQLDSISADNGTDFDLVLADNQATALEIKEGSTAYMTFKTSDSAEEITVAKRMVVSTGVTFQTDTADINGGNIDGTTIGANTAAAGTFTDATATNLQVTNIKANDGTSAGSIADATGIVTIASSVLTTTDINGGSIDGVTIGSNTAATALVVSGGVNIDDDGDGAIDGVVIGASTAAAGTFTTVDTSGNVTVGGNLTVNGTTTTIDSTTLTIEDPLLTLAKNNSGGDANTFDQGLLFNRGSLDNVAFIWDESADQFAFTVSSSEDGNTAGNITIDSYANLKANVATFADVETGTVSAADGTQSATIANATGIMTIASSVLTTTDINGGSIDGVTIGTNTAATALVVNGGVNIDDDGDGAIDGVVIGASTAAAGTFTSLTSTSLSVGEGNITNVGDIALDSISADGTDINISITDNSATALTVKEGGNVYLTFDSTNSAETITSAQNFTVATGKTFTTNTANINGGNIENTVIGSITGASTGTFTDLTATNLQVTNIKANDGTAAIVITDSTGAVAVSTALTAAAVTASGNVSVNGGTFIFNEAGADLDFRFEGDNNANLLFGDASTDRIGIGTNTPAYTLDVAGTDAIKVPAGDISQRPTAAIGVIRFNSENGTYEGSTDGSTWQSFAMGSGDISISKATATGDGSTSTFNGFFSQAPAGANNVMVFIDNVYQEPTENYTVSGTNLTFTSTPHSGARIFAMEGFDNTAVLNGGVARTLTEAVSFESSATTIMNFNASDYRSAELYVQITDTANSEYSCMKAQVIHDGSAAYIMTYGVLNTSGADTATLTAVYDNGTVNVQATSTGGSSTATVQYSLMAV